MVDTSSHNKFEAGACFSSILTPEKRLQNKVIEFHNLNGKTADVLQI
jgi:hypothetical protein